MFYLYPQIAIYGYSFCVATCKVVNLLLRNIVRTVVKDNIVRFLLFLGEICIVAVVGKGFLFSDLCSRNSCYFLTDFFTFNAVDNNL